MAASSVPPGTDGAARTSRVSGRMIVQLLVLGFLVAAAAVLQQRLADYPWHRLGDDLAAISPWAMAFAVVATALSYLVMIGYDALALAYVDHRMPFRRYAAASFVATAFGNSLGASALVGAALRARVYSTWGLPAFAIARVTGFNLLTLALGSSVLIAAGLAWRPEGVLSWLPLPAPVAVLLAASLLAGVAGYVLWCGRGKPPKTVRQWRVDRPSRPMALAQLAVSVVEWLLMAAVLYALLPEGHGLGFLPFALLFVLATTLGLLSNVPGGLGVLEAVLVTALAGTVPMTGLVTALVAYRLVYFLVPLTLAAVVLVVLEARRNPARTTGAVRLAGSLTPSVLALLLVVLGAVLIITGQLPGGAPSVLGTFTASLAGVGVLLLARGLHRRLRGAWATTLAALGLFAITHPTVPGLAALALAALLVLARGAFSRRTSALADPRGWAWPLVVTGVAAVLVWWQEAWALHATGDHTWLAAVTGDGSGTSRIALVVAVLALVVTAARLQAAKVGAAAPSETDLERAEPILAEASHGGACLLWTGDKRVLFSSAGNALLMYQVEGRSWVALGDPVGDEREFDDLLWRFLDLCQNRGGRPVLYCVRDDLADLYREHGLQLVKLGEEAVVPLENFVVSGKRRAKMRNEWRASARAGVVIEVLSGEQVWAVMPQLREISDAWLVDRRTREKSFSLGAFDEDYVARFPVAVARIDDRIVAFATLMTSGARHEVKVDLMRRSPDAPRTAMTHLFVESILWAEQQGYATFNLGMAPLSGLRTDGTGTFWERIGHFLWTHGEHFYNFRGLRHFKERFAPTWETRYVASLGGPELPRIMLDVAVLVAGGLRGVVPQVPALSASRGAPANDEAVPVAASAAAGQSAEQARRAC